MSIKRKAKKQALNAQKSALEKKQESNKALEVCCVCGRDLPPSVAFCPTCGANCAAATRSATRRARRRKKIEKEVKRIGGAEAVVCTNDLAGFKYMFEDGIAESTEGVFGRTIEFGDISYENERKDVKDDIFDKFSGLHGYFPPDSCYQINLVNFPSYSRHVDRYMLEEGPNADMAAAYNDIIEQRQREGRTEFSRRNFISFSIESSDATQAAAPLASVREGVMAQLGRLNVKSTPLTGMDRMKLMHDIVRGNHEPLLFDYDRLAHTKKEHARDFVAPGWVAYPDTERILRRHFAMPGRIVKTYHIKDFGSDLSDRALRTIRALPIPMNISLLFRPQPKGKSVQRIRQNIDVVQAEMFDYQSGVGKAGGDITLMPPALEDKEAEGRELLDFVREEDQLVAWFQGLITVFAENEECMRKYDRMLMDEKGTWSIDLVEMPLKQEQAFMSALPLATPRLPNNYRSLTTDEGAAMVPFSSQNIHDEAAKSYLIGVDTVSGEQILVNPDKTKSPHMWVFGMTGAGKGMQMNSIITHAQLQHPRILRDENTGVWVNPDPRCPQWHLFDFHAEYVALGKRFGASISRFGPGHESSLNPMDMSNAAGDLTLKDMRANTDFFLALSESVMDRVLSQREKSLLDRCLNATYQPFIGTNRRPTLKHFYASLRAEEGEVAAELADSYEMYVEGSMNSFAQQTNVVASPTMNIYEFSELGDTMQTIGILSSLQHVRQCTYKNYTLGKPTYLVFEEAQIVFDNEAAVRMLDAYFSELRKFGLHIICVTQLPNRVLNHPRAVNLFENTGLFIFLPQQENNKDKITEMFRLSSAQSDLISQSAKAGTGLVIADGVKIAMQNTIPKNNLLYEIWNTDPYKMAKLAQEPLSAPNAEKMD